MTEAHDKLRATERPILMSGPMVRALLDGSALRPPGRPARPTITANHETTP